MTVKNLFDLMPGSTKVSIFDRDKCDTVLKGIYYTVEAVTKNEVDSAERFLNTLDYIHMMW